MTAGAELADDGVASAEFSTTCVKCGAKTLEHPELRSWWPAINGKLCEESTEPPVFHGQVLTWYCKRCSIEQTGNIIVRVIRKLRG
ncbi:MAG: hypothetical protein ACU85U_12060 [Gammaproteobacteria bacterium]|jgi:hypothetical protein